MSDVAYITNAAATLAFTSGSKTVTVTGTNPILEGVLAGDLALDPNGMPLALDARGATTLTLKRNAPTSGTVTFEIMLGPSRSLVAQATATTREVWAQITAWADRGLSIPVIAQQNAPPSTPADGDRYLVGTSGSGDWSSKNNLISVWSETAGEWLFTTPSAGDMAAIDGSSALLVFDGSAWGPAVAAAGTITNAMMANMAEATIKARPAGSAGAPQDLGAAAVRSLLDLENGDISRVTGFIVANDYSDGSGSSSNDDAAVTAALAAGVSEQKPVLFTRPFWVTSEKTISSPLALVGLPNWEATLKPASSIRSIFNVTGDLVTMDHMAFDGGETPLMQCAIRVEKDWNDYPFRATNTSIIRTTSSGIRWVDGDVPWIDGIWCVDVPIALDFQNNGMNGEVRRLYCLGGQGLKIAKVSQQMEGTKFHSLQILTNSTSVSYGIDIRTGLHLDFFGVTVDQVKAGRGIRIAHDTGSPVSEINFYGLWVGAASGVSGDISGFASDGICRNIRIFGGSIYGFPNAGLAWIGVEGVATQDGNHVEGVKFYDNARDFLCRDTAGTLIANRFESTTDGIFELERCENVGVGNYFAIAPAGINGKSQYYGPIGGGAFKGFPSSSTGLRAGQLWYDSGAGNVLKVV